MSSIIKVDQIQLSDGSTPTAGDLGLSGSVVQTQSNTYKTRISVASQTWTATGYTVTLTPSSTTSKVLVSFYMGCAGNSTDAGGVLFTIRRNGTEISEIMGTTDGNRVPCTIGTRTSSQYNFEPLAFQFVDEPTTTAPVSYELYWRIPTYGTAYTNTRGGYLDSTETPRSVTTLIAQEIAG